MSLFEAIRKFYHYLTKEENQVVYESTQEPSEPETPIIEEEETLETSIENPYLNQCREWAMKKIELLHEADRHRNARALEAEFSEWINIPEGTEEIEYLSIESEE